MGVDLLVGTQKGALILRSDSPELRTRVAKETPTLHADADELAVFAATRALKDRKHYRRIADDELPLQ